MRNDADDFPNIVNELSKYKISVINDFVKLFSPSKRNHCVVTHTVILKSRSIGLTTQTADVFNKILPKVWFENEEEFWHRWNRFKKIIIFM